MRALVVYESMFGNTRAVALAIADGIAAHVAVDAIEVAQAPRTVPDDVALLVVGGPTHAHGMTTPRTRTDAAERAGDRLVSRGQGMREWLEAVRPGPGTIVTAAFDTRIKGPELLWGSAAKGAAKQLAAAGFQNAQAHSFIVEGPTGPQFDRLLTGELDRAREWGKTLAAGLGVPAPAG
ncbi:MAG: hypothetical protein A2V85_02260 [Chloroflexi bacterium RBG_16_72_14]|nr:MAG: hypothetical protein A2V85_02260 [Chloroflexi bacterium RBG_16_72_14]